MKITVNIQDDILQEASRVTGIKGITKLVHEGLQALIVRGSARKLFMRRNINDKIASFPKRLRVDPKSPYTPAQWAKIEKMASAKGKTFKDEASAKTHLKSLWKLNLFLEGDHEDIKRFLHNSWPSSMDINWKKYIHSDPSILLGKPVVKSTRLSVDFLLGLLAKGWSIKKILASYPHLTTEGLQAVFAFTAQCIRKKFTS